MDPLPTFPLFPDPPRENIFKLSAEPCSVCGKVRGMLYTVSVNGSNRRTPCCPWCIADGSAAATGMTFNEDIECSSDEYERLSSEDKALVFERTPGYVTWQGNHWLVCCGKPCIYLGEADSPDLEGRWADVIPTLELLNTWTKDQVDQFVKNVTKGQSPCVYVFQCQLCRKLKGYWDQD
jgi:uncharacterized protein CbrC (UPF0167 family)